MAVHDLAVIGGGINGCGIARDAQGRGLTVVLVEQGDLARRHLIGLDQAYSRRAADISSILSSAWCREALIEREVLLKARSAHHTGP